MHPSSLASGRGFHNPKAWGAGEDGAAGRENIILINGLFPVSLLQIEWLNVITEVVARGSGCIVK